MYVCVASRYLFGYVVLVVEFVFRNDVMESLPDPIAIIFTCLLLLACDFRALSPMVRRSMARLHWQQNAFSASPLKARSHLLYDGHVNHTGLNLQPFPFASMGSLWWWWFVDDQFHVPSTPNRIKHLWTTSRHQVIMLPPVVSIVWPGNGAVIKSDVKLLCRKNRTTLSKFVGNVLHIYINVLIAGGGLHALQIPEAMPAGVFTPGRYNYAGQALG